MTNRADTAPRFGSMVRRELHRSLHPPFEAPLVVVFNGLLIVPPFGALGIVAWLGVRYPYHPIALRERWERGRHARGPFVYRWLTLVRS